MTGISRVLLPGFLFILVLFGGSVQALEFSAQMIHFSGDQTTYTSEFFFKDNAYRFDQINDGRKILIVVHNDSAITRVLYPELKKYFELASTNRMSITNDPFQALQYVMVKSKPRDRGVDTVNGIPCNKIIYVQGGKEVITQWLSIALKFPVKIYIHAADRGIELRNIKLGPVNPAVFQIPQDYARFVNPKEELAGPPDWIGAVDTYPLLEAPLTLMLSAGDMIRIPVKPGFSILVRAANNANSSGKAQAIPFKDGQPLKNIGTYQNFAIDSVAFVKRHETEREADEIIVRSESDSLTIEAIYIPMTEYRVSPGAEFTCAYKPGRDIDVRFINANTQESVATFYFARDGQNIGAVPKEYRTVAFTNENEMDEKSLRSDFGTDFVVRVSQGVILVKAGQIPSELDW